MTKQKGLLKDNEYVVMPGGGMIETTGGCLLWPFSNAAIVSLLSNKIVALFVVAGIGLVIKQFIGEYWLPVLIFAAFFYTLWTLGDE